MPGEFLDHGVGEVVVVECFLIFVYIFVVLLGDFPFSGDSGLSFFQIHMFDQGAAGCGKQRWHVQHGLSEVGGCYMDRPEIA